MRSALAVCLLGSALAFAGPLSTNGEFEDWANRPYEKFENGEKMLQTVKHELLENYVTDVTEEALYRAAVQGMLSAVDPSRRDANKLMTPAQYAELNIEMKGELVGIGVQFKFDSPSGRADVTGVIKGSPAERAGIRVNDALLTVDGASFRGKNIRDLVNAIRGKAGGQVTLAILRDATIVTSTIERQKIGFDSVGHELLAGDIGLLTIHGFNETTPQATREALTALKSAKGLVVDLRDNEGGMLDRSVEVAKLLLPKGKVITRLQFKHGKEDVRTNDAEPVIDVPMVVLINGATRSSAELTAAALREGVHAPLIGTKTFGKWSVQVLKELPNRYVMRYTVASFKTPEGKSYEGEGIAPDIEVERDEAAAPRTTKLPDSQLRTAINFLQMRQGR